MITRAFLYIVLTAIVADAYLHLQFLSRRRWCLQLLWWLPTVLLIAVAWWLSRDSDFIPDNMTLLNSFLFAYALVVVPKALFAFFHLAGALLGQCWRKGQLAGTLTGIFAAVIAICALFYGTFVGFYQFEVRHVELRFSDLPPSFDGYRIVLWGDAHLGTLTGDREKILCHAIESINAQEADMVVFTGDLQNKSSDEIEPHKELLSSIKARDGVFSVLGNHDYPIYKGDDALENYADFGRRCATDEELGWTLLCNEHRTIHRGEDHIIIAGMENDGEGRHPQEGNIQLALWGVSRDEFVVMLEHDPTSWRRKILPHSHTQLTLSGHTHAMQFAFLGWSPVSLFYKESWGLYRIGQRAIYVTKGLGGVIPFRLGAPGEIVVITLKTEK